MTAVTLLVLAFGVFVTFLVVAGVLLIGLTEAADTDHSRSHDLTEMERRLVDRGADGNRPPAS